MKVLIIGGVAGGATAAARIRRLDETSEILILERSGFISYANCGLPYYIGKIIESKNALTLQSPAGFKSRYNIEVRTENEVTGIDFENKIAYVRDLRSGETYRESYDKLLISPGAYPNVPNRDRMDMENVFTIRNVEDTLKIDEYISRHSPASVIISGGGFIGLEMAENFRRRGMAVTIVQHSAQLFKQADADMAAVIHRKMRDEGIELILKNEITSITSENGILNVALKEGPERCFDMALLANGILPDTGFLRNTAIALTGKGHIIVNNKMETSVKDVFAVGDACEITNFVTGRKCTMPLAGPANKQGRVAADNICGISSEFTGVQGSAIIKLFDLTIACTGINERTAKELGLDYDKTIISPASHAAYYPGGKPITIKLIWSKENGNILGAQAIGCDGVDKRIDVIATGIRCGMKANELANLDLAYAPPYSSAKDPVNVAGFVAENVMTGKVRQFFYEDLAQLQTCENAFFLDTRTPAEFSRGHAQGFINIPLDELREHLDQLDKGKTIYVMCQSGLRSYLACRILTQEGFDCFNFPGGYGFYSQLVAENVR